MSSTENKENTPHGEHGHSRFLAHHFESQDQQFDAGKLGMWLFLVQEILFFSGLFCAYAIYRAHHPEIFVYADHFLDRKMGAINTCVLIFSSFTIAWGVRCAQLNQPKRLAALLVVTFLCACGFLGIKYVEYHHKWKDGLLWGRNFKPHVEQVEHGAGGEPAIHAEGAPAEPAEPRPNNVHIFFGIYFAMTGLHAIHVIIGMGIMIWMLQRTLRGDFSSEYYAPIEFTGLYWHLVDLVWIYLFPLLYLIH